VPSVELGQGFAGSFAPRCSRAGSTAAARGGRASLAACGFEPKAVVQREGDGSAFTGSPAEPGVAFEPAAVGPRVDTGQGLAAVGDEFAGSFAAGCGSAGSFADRDFAV
jgi:hypothetical protein